MVNFYIAYCLTAHKHKPARGYGHGHGHMAMAGKQKNEYWHEPRHKGGCCCFEWAVYAPWACYMPLRALYNPKPPTWPLVGFPDLAGDIFFIFFNVLVFVLCFCSTCAILWEITYYKQD